MRAKKITILELIEDAGTIVDAIHWTRGSSMIDAGEISITITPEQDAELAPMMRKGITTLHNTRIYGLRIVVANGVDHA